MLCVQGRCHVKCVTGQCWLCQAFIEPSRSCEWLSEDKKLMMLGVGYAASAVSMDAMLRNSRGSLILLDMSLLRWAIWLCIYCRKVSERHLPCFMMVVSLNPCSFRAIAPPALSECDPTSSGVIPLSCSLRVDIAARIALTM